MNYTQLFICTKNHGNMTDFGVCNDGRKRLLKITVLAETCRRRLKYDILNSDIQRTLCLIVVFVINLWQNCTEFNVKKPYIALVRWRPKRRLLDTLEGINSWCVALPYPLINFNTNSCIFFSSPNRMCWNSLLINPPNLTLYSGCNNHLPPLLISCLGFSGIYKVVQIWPGQTVTCLHTISPGHIWTTLYYYYYYYYYFRGSGVFLRTLSFLSYKRSSPDFMLPGGSLPHSKGPPPVHVLSQIDPSYFSSIHFNIILPSTPGYYKWSPSLRFSHQNSVWNCFIQMLSTCHTQHIDLITRISAEEHLTLIN